MYKWTFEGLVKEFFSCKTIEHGRVVGCILDHLSHVAEFCKVIQSILVEKWTTVIGCPHIYARIIWTEPVNFKVHEGMIG